MPLFFWWGGKARDTTDIGFQPQRVVYNDPPTHLHAVNFHGHGQRHILDHIRNGDFTGATRNGKPGQCGSRPPWSPVALMAKAAGCTRAVTLFVIFFIKINLI